MKLAILFIFGFGMGSCVAKAWSPEGSYSLRSPVKEKISRERALEIARNHLLNEGYINTETKLCLFDKGDYYTVTVALPPLTLGGGWAVDLDCYSGDIIRTYFTE